MERLNLKFLSPLCGLAAGILLAGEVNAGIAIGLILIGVAILIWIPLSLLSRNPTLGIKIVPFHNVWFFSLFAGIGIMIFSQFCRSYVSQDINGKNISYYGYIKDIKYSADGERFIIGIDSLFYDDTKLQCKNLDFLVKTDGYIASKGDIVSFNGIAREFNVKNNSSYAELMRRQGVDFYINLFSKDIKTIGSGNSLLNHFNNWRESLIILIEKSSLNRETSEFIISILLGDKSFLSSEVRQTLSSAGLAHILALSGMHVAIILSVILFILFPFSLAGYPKIRYVVAVFLIWGYVILTGYAPSTLRATIMATFLMIAIILERKNSSMNSLLAASFIILIVNPYNLWNIGFWLSFICVASILLFINKLNPIDRHIHPRLYSISNLFLMSLVTTVVTWVLISYYFKNIPLLFLPSNILLLPLLPVFVGVSLLYILLLGCGFDLHFIAKALDYFRDFFVNSADLLSLSGNAVINYRVSEETVVFWIAAMVLTAIYFYSDNLKIRKTAVSLGAACIVISVSTIFFGEKPLSGGSLRFAHSFTQFSVNKYDGENNLSLNFPRQNISEAQFDNIHILTIDTQLTHEALSQIKISEDRKDHYIYIGSGADTDQVARIVNNNNFTKVILHSGVGDKKKTELLSLLNESEWDKVYSLRDNGSLEFDL